MLFDEYSVYGNKIIIIFPQFENMSEGPFVSTKVLQHQVQRKKPCRQPALPYLSWAKASEL